MGYALHHRWQRELSVDRSVLRGSRHGERRRPHPRLPAQRGLVGKASPCPPGLGSSCHHLRPAWLRAIRASRPSDYDYDTFAGGPEGRHGKARSPRRDVLAGFSMGTGEVTRYLGTYGSDRVARAALFGPIPPFLLQTADNPLGVPQSVFDGFKETIRKDRYALFKFFFDNFYNVDKLHGTRISDEAWNASFQVAAGSSALRHPRVRHDVADGLPRRPAEDRRAPARRPGHRGPHPSHRRHWPAPPRAREGHPVHRDPRRPAQHRLDAPRRGQYGVDGLPQIAGAKPDEQVAPSTCVGHDVFVCPFDDG